MSIITYYEDKINYKGKFSFLNYSSKSGAKNALNLAYHVIGLRHIAFR